MTELVPTTECTDRFQTVPLNPEYAQEMLAPIKTFRQREVVGLAALGLSNSDIGSELQVSESTVKSHLSVAMGLMGVGSRRAVRSIAYAGGLVREALEKEEPYISGVLAREELGAGEVEIMSMHELTIDDYYLLTLARGYVHEAAAEQLNLAESSIKSRLQLLYKRLGVRSIGEAQQKTGVNPF